MHQDKLIQMIDDIGSDIKEVAREIYYARLQLRRGEERAVMIHLDLVLAKLGVTKPEDVGLSSFSLGENK
jgi:hypothetical protein